MPALTKFRRAKLSDVIFIGHLLRDFYRRLQLGAQYGVEYHHESVLQTVTNTIENGICIVGPTSCAGAVILPFVANYHARMGWVVFWSFRRARELKIAEEIAKACFAEGATHVNFASHAPHTAGRLYARLGAKEVETQYFLSKDSYCRFLSKGVNPVI